jgi:hypothetical protein
MPYLLLPSLREPPDLVPRSTPISSPLFVSDKDYFGLVQVGCGEVVLSLSISPPCPHEERLSKAAYFVRPQMSYGSYLYKVVADKV